VGFVNIPFLKGERLPKAAKGIFEKIIAKQSLSYLLSLVVIVIIVNNEGM
jgi:hypothetical protein